jgi:uncharacterized pyridoxal phosphate-dependent enzyme
VDGREIYRRFGLRTIVNCATNYTRTGGSIVSPAVQAAMNAAGSSFVDIGDLQLRAGARLAELTRNEAAYVSNGATAGLMLAVAAAMAGDDPARISRLPGRANELKHEVIMLTAHRNWYDVAVRQTGATIVDVGHPQETEEWELADAFGPATAAVVWMAGGMFERGGLPLETVVAAAHAHGVPVIVDAASQIPPVSNLWRFTREAGADLVVFSGGKNLRGPQNSGLCVGTEPLIRAMRRIGPPNQAFGRTAKTSREGIVGLVVAVEEALAVDEAAQFRAWEAVLDGWQAAWTASATEGVTFARQETNFAGEAVPRLLVSVAPASGWTRDRLYAALKVDDPIIDTHRHDARTLAFSPHLLGSGEAELVAERVARLLASGGQ